MRHQPPLVDRIAMKAAAELVVHPAGGHLVERFGDHLQHAAPVPAPPEPQQQAADPADAEISGPRRSRRAADRMCRSSVDRRRVAASADSSPLGLRAGQLRSDQMAESVRRPGSQPARGGSCQASATACKHLVETGHSHPASRRPIGAAEKRLQVGRQENRHRPAAAPGEHLHRVHVDLVQVGPLLAIDLDADEILVEQPRRSADPRSFRAPSRGTSGRPNSRSTGRSASAPLGQLQSLGTPRIPVDRIVPVLQQIGAGFVGQAIGHGSLMIWRFRIWRWSLTALLTSPNPKSPNLQISK